MKKTKKNNATFRIEKNIFKKIIKNNYNVCANDGLKNILSGIKFEYKDNVLNLISTNGNKLLINTIATDSGSGECSGVYSGLMLGKISFLKNICGNSDEYLDFLQFNMTPESLEIWDIANNFIYEVGAVGVGTPYPKYEQLFPKNISESEYTSIGFNVKYLKELEQMAVNSRTNIIKMTFKNNSPLTAVLVESDAPQLKTKSKCLIMPCTLRD